MVEAAIAFAALNAAALLGIPEDEPERLFPGNETGMKDAYHQLVKRWHPDVNKSDDAKDVFAHIGALHKAAEDKLKAGLWAKPRTFVFKAEGKTYRISYDAKGRFELGEYYIGPTTVLYALDKSYAGLFQNGVAQIRGLTFADARMQKKFAHIVPTDIKTYETADRYILTVRKDPKAVRLADLLAHEGGKLDSKHMCWIMSRMMNIACYLKWAGLSHNAIDPTTLFIDPEMHNASLLGGWWHAAKFATRLPLLPGYAADIAPLDIRKSGKADARIDLGLVRATARELLGNRTGTRLPLDSTLPKPFVAWLRQPSSGDANTDFNAWDRTMQENFGARRFVEMKTSYSDIYKPGV